MTFEMQDIKVKLDCVIIIWTTGPWFTAY